MAIWTLGDRKLDQILCQCTLGTRRREGTVGVATTVGTSHASRRGDCTQRIGVHAWLVPTVVAAGVGACGRVSSAVRAAPRVPSGQRSLKFEIDTPRTLPHVIETIVLKGCRRRGCLCLRHGRDGGMPFLRRCRAEKGVRASHGSETRCSTSHLVVHARHRRTPIRTQERTPRLALWRIALDMGHSPLQCRPALLRKSRGAGPRGSKLPKYLGPRG